MRRSMEAVRFSGAGLFFAAAGLLTLLAGFTVYSFMHSAVQTGTVLVATHDLLPGIPIKASDITSKALPVGGVPAQAISDQSKIVGQRVKFGVVSGDVLQTGHLVTKGSDIASQVASNGEDYRAAMIASALIPSADRLVPGDRLELTGVLPYQDTKISTMITVPLGLATVLSVPQSGSQADKGTVTVAVKADVASALSLATLSGTLRVTLLGTDQESPPAPPMRLDTVTSAAIGKAVAPTGALKP